jgi:hypothetical protein
LTKNIRLVFFVVPYNLGFNKENQVTPKHGVFLISPTYAMFGTTFFYQEKVSE